MKLKTEKGELSLPNDFAFDVEITNPAFSDEGDATVPTTLPASMENFKLLGNIHRIDRADRFMKRIPATLSAGTYFKKGQLIIDTIDRNNGIDVSFAIENSDVYSQYKNTSLKDIFKNKVRTFNSVAEIITLFESILNNGTNDDFTIFQIAVSKYENEKEQVIYQYCNEIVDGLFIHNSPSHDRLVYKARTVIEDGDVMSVPEGYGVSPFLKLHKMIDILFYLIGYDVVENCFSSSELKDIVLLNNCADSIVEAKIDYSDLVPSCSLTEFVEFLQEKFNAVIRVDSTKMQVRCVLVNDIIQNKQYDIDITDIVREDGFSMQVNETSRVVLSSDYMEGGEPAADTLDDLIEKYGYCVKMDESDFQSLLESISSDESVAQCNDCLIFRSYTGGFYELRRNVNDGSEFAHYIGTSNFKYDRKNSIDSEEHSSADIIPLMVETQSSRRVKIYPYVGDRTHRHTSVKSSDMDEGQDIILCWNHGAFGSITADFYGSQKQFDLTAYEIYKRFWYKYNEILLNNKVTANAIVEYPNVAVQNIDMMKPKLYRNQLLLPVKTCYNVSTKISNGFSEFLLLKDYADGVCDSGIVFLESQPADSLKWSFKSNIEDLISSRIEEIFPVLYNSSDQIIGYGGVPSQGHDDDDVAYWLTHTNHGYEFTDELDDVFLGAPRFPGESSAKILRRVKVHINYSLHVESGFNDPGQISADFDISEMFGHVWFVAE